MKILMLTPYLPYPPHAGGRIRMLELLRFLRARHDVTVVSFIFSEAEMPFVEELSKGCKRVIAIMHSPVRDDTRPRLIAEFCTSEMRNCLTALNAESHFDLVDVEHIFMAQYATFIDAPAILQEHNIESQVLRRYADIIENIPKGSPRLLTEGEAFRDAQSEWIKMAEYESMIWPQFPVRLVVSELDRREMMRRCPTGRIVSVPNGVNIHAMRAVASLDSCGVMFTGTLDYQPNLDAAFELCDFIWPLVQRRVPEARLYIVGRNPPARLLGRAKTGQIEIIADVPSLEPYAEKCSISVVPLRVGGGTRIKILISMALGLTVITTSVGCEGLELQAEHELQIADEPMYFAERIVALLEDKETRTRLANAGRVAVERRYDWQKIFPGLECVYQETARNGQ